MKIDQLTSYFSQCHDAYWVFDVDLKLIYANGASQKLTGWSPEKFTGATWQDLNLAFHEICAPNQVDLFTWKRPPRQHTFASFQLIHPKPRMIGRYVQEVAVANESNTANAASDIVYVMTFRDLTREMNIEVAKSNFLSNAAHELRTPMSSVLGFTELLLNNPYSQERTVKTLNIIHRQAQRTVDLINELLDLSRIEAQRGMHFELKSKNIKLQLQQVISGLNPAHSQRVVFPTGVKEPLWGDVDEAKFQMAFLNILSNALKYSEADTPVILKVHQTHDQDGHWIGIEVQDTGVGIKEEDMAKLFTRFYRADPTSAVSGTGLGLHLVKEIMTQMNGRVDIQSVYGQGTKACLWVKQSNSEKAA